MSAAARTPIFPKRHTGEAAISYRDPLDEALCFGWVASLVKRLDDQRFAPSSRRGGRTAAGQR